MIQYSRITLYKGVPLDATKNKMVEGIAAFLDQYAADALNVSYNYFKNDFETELSFPNNRLSLSNFEANDLGKVNAKNWNYCKIVPTASDLGETADGKPLYYFVTATRWTSEGSARLSLRLDTLNTFSAGTDYTFGARSHITRKSKPRFAVTKTNVQEDHVLNASGEWSKTWTTAAPASAIINLLVLSEYNVNVLDASVSGNTASVLLQGQPNAAFSIRFAIIQARCSVDRYSEGFTPVLFKAEEKMIAEDENNVGWNLVYRNKNQMDPAAAQVVNPVECLLVPDQAVNVKYFSTDLLPQTLNIDFFYMFSAEINGGNEFTINADGQEICKINHTATSWIWANSVDRWAYIYLDGGLIHVVSVYQQNLIVGHPYVTAEYMGAFSAIQFKGVDPTYYNSGRWSDYPQVTDKKKLIDYNLGFYAPTVQEPGSRFIGQETTGVLESIDRIDRTDSRLIKIIKLPYAPETFDTSGNYLLVPPSWEFTAAGSLLTLKDLSKAFYREIRAYDYAAGNYMQNPLRKLNRIPIEPDPAQVRFSPANSYETKLLHSDYFRPKLVYDSFGMELLPEQMDPQAVTESAFRLGFAVTSTINSKFLFTVPEYREHLLFSAEDFPGVMPVSRNNEAVLFNSQYINYIRNGYNYDLKNKTRQEIAAALGIVGNVTAAGAGIATGNPMAVLMSGAGLAQNISQIVGAEQAMEQKIAQSKMQAVSVSGSDDVDLLEVYSANRAKLCMYEVSPRVKAALDDLFYFFGYATDEYGTPEMNVRWWFDYVQGEMALTPAAHIPEEMLQDLVNRYSAGVTLFHKHGKTWDITQQKENWERGFFEE